MSTVTCIYYLLANIGFDTAENEPSKVCPLSVCRSPSFTAGYASAALPDYIQTTLFQIMLIVMTFRFDRILN